MGDRREFLSSLFARLEDASLPWCVLRNSNEVFDEDSTSDVDLLMAHGDIDAAFELSLEIAEHAGWRLVQVTRFVNHSWVFWKEERSLNPQLLRIDVDTEIRWLTFEELSGAEILQQRIKSGPLYVPAREHEIRIINTQIAWKNGVSERYKRRLQELGAPIPDPHETRVRLVKATLFNAFKWVSFTKHALGDCWRVFRRFVAPPGVYIELAAPQGSHAPRLVLRAAEALEHLLPKDRSCVVTSSVPLRSVARCGLGLRITPANSPTRRFGSAIPKRFIFVLRGWRENSFVAREEAAPCIQIGHVESGRVLEIREVEDLVTFILSARSRSRRDVRKKRKSLSIVLVGLDGSGKTTFSRSLGDLVSKSDAFTGMRYFHWLPRPAVIEMPWKSYVDFPRRRNGSSGALSRIVSSLRLFKNVFAAVLYFALRVRPLVKRGYLVVIDRYLANYWLDPLSVRYTGSPQWAARAFRLLPKPDLLVTLQAPPDVLLARKGELSREEIVAQSERLQTLPQMAVKRLDLDSRNPPEELARRVLEAALSEDA